MNEIQLSNDLTQITTEIKTYENMAGQAIFEIGRRLNWVKEHDLAHGQFGDWLKEVGISHRVANRFMKIANELSNWKPASNLGAETLYLIATLPPEERDKEQQLSDGEVKKPEDMTKRELQELKKELKAKNQEIADKAEMIASQQEELEESRQAQIDLNRQLALKKEPKVEVRQVPVEIEKKVEVPVKTVPADYENIKRQNEAQAEELRQLRLIADNYDNLKVEVEQKEAELKNYRDLDHLNNQVKHYETRGDLSIYKLTSDMKEFLQAHELTSDDKCRVSEASKEAKNKLQSYLNDTQAWIDSVRPLIDSRAYVEGEIVNE